MSAGANDWNRTVITILRHLKTYKGAIATSVVINAGNSPAVTLCRCNGVLHGTRTTSADITNLVISRAVILAGLSCKSRVTENHQEESKNQTLHGGLLVKKKGEQAPPFFTLMIRK